jgi:hypothetical protein
MQIKQENNVKSRRFQAKTSAWWLEKSIATLHTILKLCIPDKELTKTHSQSSFIHIFPKSFMIFPQELLDAAVSLWTNIIPKGIIKQI